MIKKGLIPYIESNIKKGFSHKHIIDAFVKRGYLRKDVEETFAFYEHHKKHKKRKIHKKVTKESTIFIIVLIHVAIIALAYSLYQKSVNPPQECGFEGQFACKSFNIRGGEVLVTLSNSIGYDVRNAIVVVEGCGNSARLALFRKNSEQTFHVICPSELKGNKYSGAIRLDYTSDDTIYSVFGKLSGKIEKI